ncbi:MAG: HAMP domain-containing protein [Deltaproteobacteria bacterium]|nr:HAMP domain-containing protein [Deltaproteobacteria bacterium]
MNQTIRWKLLGSYLLILLVAGSLMAWQLHQTLGDYLLKETRDNLLNEAGLTALLLEKSGLNLVTSAPTLAQETASRTKSRVTIMTATGQVIGDSDVGREELKNLENHLTRPEIQAAQKESAGSALRYSSTLMNNMLYVAVPFNRGRPEAGFVRLALPLHTLEQAKGEANAILFKALGAAAFLAVILSLVFSHVIVRLLRQFSALAVKIGHGDFSRRLPVGRRDELGELALVINEMSSRLSELVGQLTSEKRNLDTIVRSLSEGLMVTDSQGRLTMINPAFLKMFPTELEMIGRPLIEVTRYPAMNETLSRVIASREEQVREITIIEGQVRTLLTHWAPLVDQESVYGVVAVFHDISYLKKLENIRRDFVANISHELRTPVTVIAGYAETLLNGVLDTDLEAAKRFTSIIYKHAQHLTLLISGLLTLSELESGALTLNLAPVALAEIFPQVNALLGTKAEEKNIALKWPETAELPPVMAEAGRLVQILINLVDNAIKYSPAGGQVTIGATTEKEDIIVSVQDTGPGIPPRALNRLFERFYRVDPDRNRESGGTGLGLAIVKHLVQLHGGNVSVTSTPGRGSTFSFTLKTT